VRVGGQAETDEARLHLVQGDADLGPRRLVGEVGIDPGVEGIPAVAGVEPARAEMIEPVEAHPEGERLGERLAGQHAEGGPLLGGVVDRVAPGNRPHAAGLAGASCAGRQDEGAGRAGQRFQKAAARGHEDLPGAPRLYSKLLPSQTAGLALGSARFRRPSLPMITVCAWCQRYMGSTEPPHDHVVSHGICPECTERETLGDTPVLVVSRDRADTIPLLHSLLRGAPEITIVVDRRAGERRTANGKDSGHSGFAVSAPDRRAAERRRKPTFYLI
jgi:hypothetical protein